MSQDKDLKPCPFCGGEAKYMKEDIDMGKPYPSFNYEWCKCSNHMCNAHKIYHKTILWNTRTNDQQESE